MKLATAEGREVARSLRALVPLIKVELDAGDNAGIEHYRKAGELLLEAKEQLERGEWMGWVERNFHLSLKQAQRYMALASLPDNRRARPFSSMREALGPSAGGGRASWHQPVQDILSRVNVEALARDQQDRAHEAAALHKLGHDLINAGYKALASKLHPDRKGGSSIGMARLNKVRAILKGAI